MPDHAGSPDHPHADHSSHHPDGFPEDGGKEFRPDDHLRSGIRGIPESPGSTSLPPYTLFPIDSIPPEVRDVAGRLRELVSSPEFAAKYPAFTAGALAGALISLAGASGRSAGPTASAGSGAPISPQIRATEAIRAAVADSSPAAMDTGAARMSPAEARAALDAKFGDSGARPIPSATAAALTAEHSGVRGGGSAADPKAGSAMWQENPNAVGVVPGGDGSAAGARPAGGAASDFSAPSGVHRSGGAPAGGLSAGGVPSGQAAPVPPSQPADGTARSASAMPMAAAAAMGPGGPGAGGAGGISAGGGRSALTDERLKAAKKLLAELDGKNEREAQR